MSATTHGLSCSVVVPENPNWCADYANVSAERLVALCDEELAQVDPLVVNLLVANGFARLADLDLPHCQECFFDTGDRANFHLAERQYHLARHLFPAQRYLARWQLLISALTATERFDSREGGHPETSMQMLQEIRDLQRGTDLIPTGFSFEILKIYRAGYFPCGWDEVWPDGKLWVY